MTLHELIDAKVIRQADLARVIGTHRSAVHKKLRGERPWLLVEMHAVLAHLRRQHDAALTLDALFPAPRRARKRVAA